MKLRLHVSASFLLGPHWPIIYFRCFKNAREELVSFVKKPEQEKVLARNGFVFIGGHVKNFNRLILFPKLQIQI